MNIRKAVYAGTFDPPTLGHVWMLKQASMLFDEVVFAIGTNPDKKTMFSVGERLDMMRHIVITNGLTNVLVSHYENDYLIRYAQTVGANVIVRGVRTVKDHEYEKVMRNVNADIDSNITTVFLMPPRDLCEVASSMVKGLMGPPGWETIVSPYVPPVVLRRLKQRFVIPAARKHWESLVAKLNLKDSDKVFDSLVRRYGKPDRHYHTLPHIVGMLDELQEFEASYPTGKVQPNFDSIKVAIWFHDAVYDSQASDNEEVSADLAKEFLEGCALDDAAKKGMQAQVHELIMATKHTGMSDSEESDILVDLDLAIFGRPAEEFDRYEAAIRDEYNWVPEKQFAAKRAEVLQSFLPPIPPNRMSIYRTRFFYDRYEQVAQENLKRSIAKWSK